MRFRSHRQIEVVPAVIRFAMLSGAFDDRSALDHAEPFDLRVFGDDLEVDAERGAVFDGFGP
jgi:hypothetical protein